MNAERAANIYEHFAEELPFGLMLLDGAGRALAWNRAARELAGYQPQEVLGRSCDELLLFDCAHRFPGRCQELRSPEGCGTCQLAHTNLFGTLLRHKEGHAVPVLLRTIPLGADKQGECLALMFQQKSAAHEVHAWMSRRITQEDELGLPDVEASREELELVMGLCDSQALVIGLEESEHLLQHFGRELVTTAMRNIVRSVSYVVSVPHYLGRWTADNLILLLPFCEEEEATRIRESIRQATQEFGVRWWGDRVNARVHLAQYSLADAKGAGLLVHQLGAADHAA